MYDEQSRNRKIAKKRLRTKAGMERSAMTKSGVCPKLIGVSPYDFPSTGIPRGTPRGTGGIPANESLQH